MKHPPQLQQPSLFDAPPEASEKPVVTQNVPVSYSTSEPPPPVESWTDALAGYVAGRK